MMEGQARKRLGKRAKKGFRGFPLATIAFYGPDDRRATKLAVGIILEGDQEPAELRRWFTGGAYIRDDPDTAEEVLAFPDRFGVRSVTMVPRHRLPARFCQRSRQPAFFGRRHWPRLASPLRGGGQGCRVWDAVRPR